MILRIQTTDIPSSSQTENANTRHNINMDFEQRGFRGKCEQFAKASAIEFNPNLNVLHLLNC